MGKRQLTVDIQVILFVIIGSAWSLYYYLSTVNDPEVGVESVFFIKPLVFVLIISALFALKSAIHIKPLKDEIRQGEKDRGLLHPKRLFYTISLPVHALLLLPYFGFIPGSIIYLVGTCYFLGLRRMWVFISLILVYSALLYFGFKLLLNVPIPLWPSFSAFSQS